MSNRHTNKFFPLFLFLNELKNKRYKQTKIQTNVERYTKTKKQIYTHTQSSKNTHKQMNKDAKTKPIKDSMK